MTMEAFLIIAAWAFCAGYTVAAGDRCMKSTDLAICIIFGPLLCPADLGAEAFRRLNPKGDEK
jgi:hypothetical protein